jgi:hypothetical protein
MLAGYFPIMAALGLALRRAFEKHSVALPVLPFVGAWISVLF